MNDPEFFGMIAIKNISTSNIIKIKHTNTYTFKTTVIQPKSMLYRI